MQNVIETVALTKRYGTRNVVNGASAHVKKGDIYGLIGKNGAGKTTLMRLILGLATPTAGTIKIFGDEKPEAARRKIGSLVETPAFYKNETAFENLKRFSYLAPTSDEDIKQILDMVGIGDTGAKKVGAFSLGMKQRLGLGIALLGKPDILILDEPINGLDPAGIKEIRDIILNLNGKGVTFIISSHILDELGKIATNYGIMHEGVLEEISAEELRAKCRSCLKIAVDDSAKAAAVLKKEFEDAEFTTDGNVLRVSSKVKDASAINRALVNAGVCVYELTGENLSFEDFFIDRLGR